MGFAAWRTSSGNRVDTLALRLPSPSWGSFPNGEGVPSMRNSWVGRFWAVLVVVILAAAVGSAQQNSLEESKRKIKFRNNPQYTDLARKMNLSGKVKIEVVIASDGRVKSSRAIGGHPILVQSCLDAVKDWRFEAASEETTQIIEFEFKQ